MELENLFNDNESTAYTGAEDLNENEINSTSQEGAEGTENTLPENQADGDDGIPAAVKNRIAAAARRESEQKYSAFRSEVDEFYKKNGYEGFSDYKQKYEDEQKRRVMENAPDNLGFSGNDIDPMVRAIVSEMPEFKAAKELARENAHERERMEFESALKKITELDPTIKTAEDLANMENAEMFNRLVFENGIPLVDAFRFANMDRLLQQNEAKTRQDTLNKVNSKSHLSPVSGVPGDEFKVPDDVKAEYRTYFPGITDEEIAKHYKENHDS